MDAPVLLQITLATCDSANMLSTWAQGAGVGECRCYAQGRVPPRAHPGFVLARTLCEAGLVSLRQETDPATRVTRYVARRSAAPWQEAVRQSAAAAAQSQRGEAENELLKIVQRCVRRGELLPSNAVLARAIGVRAPVDASNLLRKLAKAGLVAIEQQGPNLPRLVRLP